jgi:hypothetical protein
LGKVDDFWCLCGRAARIHDSSFHPSRGKRLSPQWEIVSALVHTVNIHRPTKKAGANRLFSDGVMRSCPTALHHPQIRLLHHSLP